MRRWERFYRWLGGRGPELSWHPEVRLRLCDHLAYFLLRRGFLKRDPSLSGRESTYFVNHLWQWRFWRGPYRDWTEANWGKQLGRRTR